MSVLITGGTGFLGVAIARQLIQTRGESGVVLFDSFLDYGLIQDIRDQVIPIQGDVLEPTELISAMAEHGVDRVVHLAYLQGPAVDANPPRSIKLNCVGTTNVFEAARMQGAKRVVYASSMGVYSIRRTLDDQEVDEDSPADGQSLYGACKLLNEVVAHFYQERHGLDPIGMRPTAVFGIGRTLSRLRSHGHSKMLVADLTAGGLVAVPGALLQGEPVQMPPDDQIVDWIYAPDLAEAFCCALDAQDPAHRIFNVSAERRPIRDFTQYLRNRFPDAQINSSSEPAVAMRLTSTQRLRADLGFQPKYNLEMMLDDYIEAVESGKAMA